MDYYSSLFASKLNGGGGGITPSGTKSITENGTYDVTTYESADVNVPVGWTSDDVAMRNYSGSVIANTASAVKAQAFKESNITSFSGGEVTSIAENSFESCASLASAYLPKCASFGNYSFKNCASLISVFVDVNITSFGTEAFSGCSNLVSFPFEKINVNFNPDKGFRYCTSLVGAYAPEAKSLGAFSAGLFQGCTSLKYARFPKATGIMRQDIFKGCTSLKLVDTKSSSISVGGIFVDCTVLETLILRNTSVMSLNSISNFDGVESVVKIYCPSSLITSYQTATNWSTLYNDNRVQFLALEGSPYEQTDYIYEGVPAND